MHGGTGKKIGDGFVPVKNRAAPYLITPCGQNLPDTIRAVALYGDWVHERLTRALVDKCPRDTYDEQRLSYRLLSRLNKP